MRKNIILLLVGVVFLLSCDKKSNNERMIVEQTNSSSIINQVLVKEIQSYHSLYFKDWKDDYLVLINCTKEESITTIEIDYSCSLFRFIENNNFLYTKAGNIYVAMSFGYSNFLTSTEKFKMFVLKKKFPSDFRYYETFDEFPVPMGVPLIRWTLKFKKGKLISKVIVD